MVCPTDAQRGTPMTDTSSPTPADRSPRSYLINGWNGYFPDALTVVHSMKESEFIKPSATIIFGEKKHIPDPRSPVLLDYFMDLLEHSAGDGRDDVDHRCHSRP